jgi:hypothetical protein
MEPEFDALVANFRVAEQVRDRTTDCLIDAVWQLGVPIAESL